MSKRNKRSRTGNSAEIENYFLKFTKLTLFVRRTTSLGLTPVGRRTTSLGLTPDGRRTTSLGFGLK